METEEVPDSLHEATQWSLEATRSSLEADPSLAVLMLRLGAAVNAISAARGWYLACLDEPGTSGQRDRFAAFLVLAAFLHEAIHSLLIPNCAIISAHAMRAGVVRDSISRLEELSSKQSGSLYEVLGEIRDKVMFHWDKYVFEKWISNCNDDPVEWARSSSSKEGDCVHWAASKAILKYALQDESESAKREKKVAEECDFLGRIFQMAIKGYLAPYMVNGNESGGTATEA